MDQVSLHVRATGALAAVDLCQVAVHAAEEQLEGGAGWHRWNPAKTAGAYAATMRMARPDHGGWAACHWMPEDPMTRAGTVQPAPPESPSPRLTYLNWKRR
jgi:hypothetical protein